MSVRSDGLPGTVGRGVAIAAAVGAIALIVREPTVAAGAVVGLGLAAAIGCFAGSYRRVTVGAVLLPIAVCGGVAVVGLAGAVLPGLSAVVGILLALAVCGVVAGQPARVALLRAGGAALCSAAVAGGSALLALGVDATGGARPALAAVVWLTGDGVSGLLVALVVAFAAVAGALFLVPPAALTVPARRDAYVSTRNALVTGAGFATGLAVVGIAILLVLSRLVPPLAPLVDAIADGAAVRGLIAALTWTAVVVAALATATRAAWIQADNRRNAAVAVVAGSIPGTGLPFAGTIAVGVDLGLVVTLFGATALVLGCCWLAAWMYEGAVLRGEAPSPVTAVAAALAAGGVVTGASVDTATLGLETVRAGAATFVPIATALFAYDVGRYGRTLARDVGTDASRRPQLVRLGWSGAVAAVGVPVAALGLAGATLLAPTLSVPATAGVVVAVVAIVAGAWTYSSH